MQLTPKTLTIIKSFAGLNSALLFPVGNVLETMSISKTVLAKAKLDQEFIKRFAIAELSRFLGAISLFENPDLEFEKTHVKILSGKQKIKYTYADEDAILKPDPKKKIKAITPYIIVTLPKDDLKSFLNATSALGVPEIAILGDGDGKITIQALDSRNPKGDSYSLELGETNKIFMAVYKSEYLFKIIPQEYHITISDEGISHFKAEDLEYYIALEAKSSKFL